MHCFVHIVILSIFPIAKPRRIFLISTDDICTALLPRLSIEYLDENKISRVDYYNSILSPTSGQFGEAILFDDLSAQSTMPPFRSQNGLRPNPDTGQSRLTRYANLPMIGYIYYIPLECTPYGSINIFAADRHHSTCNAGTTYSVRLCGMAMHCPTWRLSKESRMGLLRQPRCQIIVTGSRKTKSKKKIKQKQKQKL